MQDEMGGLTMFGATDWKPSPGVDSALPSQAFSWRRPKAQPSKTLSSISQHLLKDHIFIGMLTMRYRFVCPRVPPATPAVTEPGGSRAETHNAKMAWWRVSLETFMVVHAMMILRKDKEALDSWTQLSLHTSERG